MSRCWAIFASGLSHHYSARPSDRDSVVWEYAVLSAGAGVWLVAVTELRDGLHILELRAKK